MDTGQQDEFQAFRSISRLSRRYTVTEKIDGTNAQVFVSDDLSIVRAGSRNRWVTPESDNYGFAAWVKANEDELRKLGPGRHFGEWWGAGIQRRYGMTEKRFSLFNIYRWGDEPARDTTKYPEQSRPGCCDVVPLLGGGPLFDTDHIESILTRLREHGSFAAPGFMNPEGIVVLHESSRALFKKTLDGDAHKGAVNGSTP